MVTFIKQIFSFSEAVTLATFWDYILMFFFGALIIFEIYIICAILGIGLYSLGEYLKNKRSSK